MDLAREGRLRDPEVLAQEARRMLADPRSRALADQFGAQWLGFSDILDVAVDFRRFPGKFHEVRRSMYEEAARLFDDVVKGDHDVLRLLDADYTWLDARLAAHYGIPGVEGEEMRPVALTDRRRGGVLGMGAVLAPTAFPLRTSPTLRGKWILDNLLGIPPPPPPPDAGQLPSDDVQPDGLTLRERLERHRADRACAGCHARMDPLGYALENFDPTGRWRDTLQEKPIDNQGMLPDGTTVAGPVELRAWLLTRSDRFLGHLADRLFTYGVGRPAGPADRAMLASMAARVGARGRRMQDLIVEIVVSRPFRYRGG
jgi:hypothetical protein